MNIHKAFSDIEQDVVRHYAGSKVDTDALTTALKIAGRALAIADYLHGGEKVSDARQLILDVLLDRQR